MRIGHLKQRANPYLVMFVLVCSVVVAGLLFVIQKTEALKDNF